ncbi:hypothetical protein C6P41_002613, partial [Kluyveromyces marxianus]
MSNSSSSEGKTNEDGRNSVHSSDSFAQSVASFHLDDNESQNVTAQLSQQITNVLSNSNGAERIESLARVISTKTKKQMESFEVNQLDFDLKALLNYLRSSQLEQGIEPGDSGIAFHDLTAVGIDASAAFGPSVEEMVRSWIHSPVRLWKKICRQKGETPLRNIIQHCTGV